MKKFDGEVISNYKKWGAELLIIAKKYRKQRAYILSQRDVCIANVPSFWLTMVCNNIQSLLLLITIAITVMH